MSSALKDAGAHHPDFNQYLIIDESKQADIEFAYCYRLYKLQKELKREE